MSKEPRLRFALTRDVPFPSRAGKHEAGIDFFIPKDLTVKDLIDANVNAEDIRVVYDSPTLVGKAGVVYLKHDKNYVTSIIFGPGSRIIIPSGVYALIEPWDSALIVANKTGVSTKKGLIFGGQVIDSTYTGEIHICLINPGYTTQSLKVGDKAIQLIHTPYYPTEPEHINFTGPNGYLENAKGWSKRGDNWQGSTDHTNDIEPYNDGPNS